MKHGWASMHVAFLVVTAACNPAADGSAVRPTGATSATGAAGSASPPGTEKPATDACEGLRAAVVDEASKMGACKTDADCTIHASVLCNFEELDCYAIHVDRAKDTTALDRAVSAFAASCSPSKCRCERPAKSVCDRGKCTRG